MSLNSNRRSQLKRMCLCVVVCVSEWCTACIYNWTGWGFERDDDDDVGDREVMWGWRVWEKRFACLTALHPMCGRNGRWGKSERLKFFLLLLVFTNKILSLVSFPPFFPCHPNNGHYNGPGDSALGSNIFISWVRIIVITTSWLTITRVLQDSKSNQSAREASCCLKTFGMGWMMSLLMMMLLLLSHLRSQVTSALISLSLRPVELQVHADYDRVV